MPDPARPRPNLGDILTRLKLVNEEQVQAALALQRETGRLFGECLLELGHIAEDDLGWALSSQLQLPFANVTADMADPELLLRFPRDFLRRNLVLPLVAADEVLSAVLADPTDELTVARLKRISGCRLNLAVATPTALKHALDQLLGPAGGAEDGDEDGAEGGSAGGAATLASPELTRLLERAFTESASAVHLDTEDGKVRVRFRVGGGLKDGGTFPVRAARDMVESFDAWLGTCETPSPGVRVWNGDGEEGPAPVRAAAVTGRDGLSVTLTLAGGTLPRPRVSASHESEWELLHTLLGRPRGLILGVAPSDAEREVLLGRILGQVNGAERRVWVLAPDETPISKRFAVRPGAATVEETRTFAALDGVDILAGIFPGIEHARPLVDAAGKDRLVVAVLPGNSALGTVVRLLESGVSATLLGEALLAAAALRVLPEGDAGPRALTEVLFVDPAFRRMLQNGGRTPELRAAARRQGFVELAARARQLETLDPVLIEDLDRHRYLEDAA